MTFDILTLFPGFFRSPLSEGLIHRGIEKGILRLRIFNLRDFTADRHRTVDDRPFGGGAGMVLKPEPIWRAMTWLKKIPGSSPRIIHLTPQGRPLDQERVKELARYRRLLLICGRYEGVDERIGEHFCDEQLSIGDYVLSAGEPAALVLLDAVSRLLPDVLGSAESPKEESFEEALLEYPHYTRPRNFKGFQVPEVLLGGDHEKIRAWRRRQALLRTLKRRPAMLQETRLSPVDRETLKKIKESE
jgi:tRNA (guanine37-N1)-methyltransferase